MKTQEIFKLTVTFVLLLAAGVAMAVAARLLPDTFEQVVLVGMGSALVSGSLAFYLNQMFNLNRKSQD